MRPIYIAGEGWGNDCAQRGLKKVFEEVISIGVDGKETLGHLKGETIVFAGYKPLVPHDVLANNDCVNVHYSLLPKYRGLHATVWMFLNDEDYVGLTIHQMTDFIDDGPIIHQYKVKNDRIRTCPAYMESFNDYIAEHLGEIMKDYIEGKITLQKNDKKEATWVGRRNHQDCRIDFSRDLNFQRCFFRTLVDPYPLPYVEYKGQELIVTKVEYHPVNVDTHIGRILNVDEDGIWVKAKDGYLIIKELRDVEGNTVTLSQFKIGQYFNK